MTVPGVARHSVAYRLPGLCLCALVVSVFVYDPGINGYDRAAFSDMDRIGKFSDEVGISTEKLVSYEHAAAQTGTSIEALNKGLQRMVRRIGEARAGYGEGLKGIEQLGLTSEQLAAMDMSEAFEAVAEKIKSIEDPAKRAAAAYALFGRQGQDLMNLLMSGKDGIAAYVAEAEKLGITFSREEAAKVEAYNDAFDELKKRFIGLARDAAPAVAEKLNLLLDLVRGNEVKILAWVAGIGAAITIIPRIAGAIRGLISIYHSMAAAKAAALALSGPKGWAMLLAGGAIAATALTGIAALYHKIDEGAVKAHESTIKQAEGVKQLAGAYDKLGDSAQQAAEQVSKAAEEEEKPSREEEFDRPWKKKKLPKAQAGESEHESGRVTMLRKRLNQMMQSEEKGRREENKKIFAELQRHAKQREKLIAAQTEVAEELNTWRVQWGMAPKIEISEVEF